MSEDVTIEEGVVSAKSPSLRKDFDPLWLPKGSIRGLISLAVTGTVCFMVVSGVVVPDWFQLFFSGTVAIYFKTRVDATSGNT